MSLRFDAQASGCRWRGLPSLALYAQGKATADVVNVAPGVFFIQRLLTETLQETVSVFADTRSGQALMVASRIGERERPGATGFRQRFTAAKIDGIPRRGAPPALTTDSIGRRAFSMNIGIDRKPIQIHVRRLVSRFAPGFRVDRCSTDVAMRDVNEAGIRFGRRVIWHPCPHPGTKQLVRLHFV